MQLGNAVAEDVRLSRASQHWASTAGVAAQVMMNNCNLVTSDTDGDSKEFRQLLSPLEKQLMRSSHSSVAMFMLEVCSPLHLDLLTHRERADHVGASSLSSPTPTADASTILTFRCRTAIGARNA